MAGEGVEGLMQRIEAALDRCQRATARIEPMMRRRAHLVSEVRAALAELDALLGASRG
ncbi:hypothetical protein [Thermaurantiacus tibetensis]|uniref:hypothetical protein n=1 Tax=Thermaurantiacus tibetensis TaxID=2759035 RepID=UPI00188F2FA3|nr:hypothetical protein [Thermaurantiacus tibetensis]